MARLFNGTSDLIAAHAAATFTEQAAYWVAFWVNAPAQSGTPTSQTAWSEGRALNSNPFILIGKQVAASSKKAIFVVRNNGGGTSQVNTAVSTAVVFDGTWHHIIYTQDGAATCNWKTYIDGVADVSGSYTSGTTTIDRLGIGCDIRAGGAAQFFNGTIAHAAKGARLLAAPEAALLAAGLPAAHLGPDYYWPLWGVDSPEPDIGNLAKVSGTLTGTTLAAEARVGLYLVKAAFPQLGAGNPLTGPPLIVQTGNRW